MRIKLVYKLRPSSLMSLSSVSEGNRGAVDESDVPFSIVDTALTVNRLEETWEDDGSTDSGPIMMECIARLMDVVKEYNVDVFATLA